MEAAEIIEVDDKTQRVSCDGGGGAMGHPKVYLALDATGRVDCPYCGRRFQRKQR
ncbi:MAG: zinc-finger domain-containing protein [Alphaproteobacteria bacterium]|nr:zinc-finger domain-containing protein [Alphaproteobacteria bacterium]